MYIVYQYYLLKIAEKLICDSPDQCSNRQWKINWIHHASIITVNRQLKNITNYKKYARNQICEMISIILLFYFFYPIVTIKIFSLFLFRLQFFSIPDEKKKFFHRFGAYLERDSLSRCALLFMSLIWLHYCHWICLHVCTRVCFGVYACG